MGNTSINKQSISPLKLGGWQFPIEPKISVRGSNALAINLIAKNKDVGPVVEFWQQEALEIRIEGRLIGLDKTKMVDDDIQKIHSLTKSFKLECSCPFLSLYGVEYVVIKDYDFPNTPGENNQDFVINAIQIKPFDLF